MLTCVLLLNELISRDAHERKILEIFPHRHYIINGSCHFPPNHPLYGWIAGGAYYLYSRTRSIGLLDHQKKNETLHCRTADYCRNNSRFSGSCGIVSVAIGRLAETYQS